MPETLYLAINLVDRFLSFRFSSLAKLQLVGVTCMFIAAKVEETLAPSVTNFITQSSLPTPSNTSSRPKAIFSRPLIGT